MTVAANNPGRYELGIGDLSFVDCHSIAHPNESWIVK